MFTMEVETGNAAMNSPEDVLSVLEDVAQEIGFGRVEGALRDGNGNTVGKWELSLAEHDDH